MRGGAAGRRGAPRATRQRAFAAVAETAGAALVLEPLRGEARAVPAPACVCVGAAGGVSIHLSGPPFGTVSSCKRAASSHRADPSTHQCFLDAGVIVLAKQRLSRTTSPGSRSLAATASLPHPGSTTTSMGYPLNSRSRGLSSSSAMPGCHSAQTVNSSAAPAPMCLPQFWAARMLYTHAMLVVNSRMTRRGFLQPPSCPSLLCLSAATTGGSPNYISTVPQLPHFHKALHAPPLLRASLWPDPSQRPPNTSSPANSTNAAAAAFGFSAARRVVGMAAGSDADVTAAVPCRSAPSWRSPAAPGARGCSREGREEEERLTPPLLLRS